MGELVRPIFLSESEFVALQSEWFMGKGLSFGGQCFDLLPHFPADKLTGMHETSGKLEAESDTDPSSVRTAILEVANVSQVSYTRVKRYRNCALSTLHFDNEI